MYSPPSSRNRHRCVNRPLGSVREDLFDLGVVAVVLFGLDHHEPGVGEHGVVAPEGEQLVLARGGLLVQVPDPADDQPRGDGLAFLRRERGVLRLGDLGVRYPRPQLVIQTACGYLMAVHASSLMPAIAARMLEFIGTVTENRAPAGRIALITAAE